MKRLNILILLFVILFSMSVFGANLIISEGIIGVDESVDITCSGEEGETIISYLITIDYPGGGQFSIEQDTLTFSDTSQTGVYDVVCEVTNDLEETTQATGNFMVEENDAPVIDSYSPSSSVSLDEGSSQEFTQESSDPDEDELSYSWLFDDSKVSTDSSYTYSPDYDESGNYNLTLIVSDGSLESSTEWSVTVNDVSSISIDLSSSDTTINLGESVDLECTITSNGSSESVEIDVEGDSKCTGTTSCSDTYTPDEAGTETVTCSASNSFEDEKNETLTLTINDPDDDDDDSSDDSSDDDSSDDDLEECDMEHFDCGDWSKCVDETQTRSCESIEDCDGDYEPLEEKDCVVVVEKPKNKTIGVQVPKVNETEEEGMKGITGRTVDSFKNRLNLFKRIFLKFWSLIKGIFT